MIRMLKRGDEAVFDVSLRSGDACARCGCLLNEIEGSELDRAVRLIKPTLKSPSLPYSIRQGRSPSARRRYVICSQCDEYALGAELETGFSLVGQA